MRSVTDLLRTYNFVNTPEGQRGTVRFFAALAVVAAGGFMVFFIAFGGGTDTDSTYQYGPNDGEPDEVYVETLPRGDGWYIGYPTALYDPDHLEWYDEEKIDQRINDWKPDDVSITREPVHSDDEHNVLLGYQITLSDPLRLLNR